MSILTWMGATVTAYLENRYTWWDQALDALVCPTCGRALRRHSERDRAAWSDFALRAEERLPVLRIYCPHCRGTHTLLPDFLTPRHRYQVPEREAVVSGAAPKPVCCAQTVRRWKHAFGAVVSTAIQAVRAWILTECRTLGQQDPRFWRSQRPGVEELCALRDLAVQYGRVPNASGLFGWINREFGHDQAFVL